MKSLKLAIVAAVISILASVQLMAVEAAVKAPATVTPTASSAAITATAATTPTEEATPQPKPAIQPQQGPATKYSIDIKTDYQEDSAGQVISNKLSLKAKQTLFDNFLAEADIRFDKPMSNENSPVTTEILTAKFQYVNNYFNITAGRAELTKTISTLNFFGPFCTAGQRYLDLVGFTIPFYLKAGIPELEEIDLPPLALSVYYFPTMFNYLHTAYDGSQEYYLFQVRANAEIAKCPSQVIINVGKSTSDYFNYSILSTNPAIDVSVSTDLGNHFKINACGAVLNTSLFQDTSVIAGGIELHNFSEWIFVIDELIFETQMPLIQGAAAGFDPQKFPWFVSVRNKIGKFRYGLAATTSNNDYTFNSLVSYDPNFAPPFGSGNVYAPEGIQFNGANAGGAPCWYGYVGYEY